MPWISLCNDGVVLVLPLPDCYEWRSVFCSYSVTALRFCATDTLESPWAFRKKEEGATGISELLSSIQVLY